MRHAGGRILPCQCGHQLRQMADIRVHAQQLHKSARQVGQRLRAVRIGRVDLHLNQPQQHLLHVARARKQRLLHMGRRLLPFAPGQQQPGFQRPARCQRLARQARHHGLRRLYIAPAQRPAGQQIRRRLPRLLVLTVCRARIPVLQLHRNRRALLLRHARHDHSALQRRRQAKEQRAAGRVFLSERLRQRKSRLDALRLRRVAYARQHPGDFRLLRRALKAHQRVQVDAQRPGQRGQQRHVRV